MTVDVDLTIVAGFGGEAACADLLLSKMRGRIPDARPFALRNRVLLLEDSAGMPIDVALGAMPFEHRCVQRSSPWSIGPDDTLRTCSAEDLIVLKAFAGRERDWLDIEGIVARQPSLDRKLIWQELEPLLDLKGDTASAERLRQALSD